MLVWSLNSSPMSSFFCSPSRLSADKKCQIEKKFYSLSFDIKYEVRCTFLCTCSKWPDGKEQERWFLPSLAVPESRRMKYMYNGKMPLASICLRSYHPWNSSPRPSRKPGNYDCIGEKPLPMLQPKSETCLHSVWSFLWDDSHCFLHRTLYFKPK